MPTLLLLLNKEPEEMVEAEQCKRRGPEEDRDEMLLSVDELGVEGLMRGGTSDEWGGDEDLRCVRGVREYG